MSATGSPFTVNTTRSPPFTASTTCAVLFRKSRTPISMCDTVAPAIRSQVSHFSRDRNQTHLTPRARGVTTEKHQTSLNDEVPPRQSGRSRLRELGHRASGGLSRECRRRRRKCNPMFARRRRAPTSGEARRAKPPNSRERPPGGPPTRLVQPASPLCRSSTEVVCSSTRRQAEVCSGSSSAARSTTRLTRRPEISRPCLRASSSKCS